MFCLLSVGNSFDNMEAHQYPPELLSYLSGSDAIDDRVETAREKRVHGAEEHPNGSRETISDPKWQESNEYNNQTDTDDHNMGDTSVKSFDIW